MSTLEERFREKHSSLADEYRICFNQCELNYFRGNLIDFFLEQERSNNNQSPDNYRYRLVYGFFEAYKSSGTLFYKACSSNLSRILLTEDSQVSADDMDLSCFFIYELFENLRLYLPKIESIYNADLECERTFESRLKTIRLTALVNIEWLPAFFNKVTDLLNSDVDINGASRDDYIKFLKNLGDDIHKGLVVFKYPYNRPSEDVLGDNGISNFIEKINELYKKITGCQKSLGTIGSSNKSGQ